MNRFKFHQLVTKTGIISLAALAVIGILATFFGVCELDLDFFPEVLEKILFFILSTLSILVCFCFPVSFLLTLIDIASRLRTRKQNTTETNPSL